MTTFCPICAMPQSIDVTNIGDSLERKPGAMCCECKSAPRRNRLVLGQNIGKQVMDALGINVDNVTKLSLHFEVNAPVRCVVESFAGRDGINALTKVLQDFELVKRADPQAGG